MQTANQQGWLSFSGKWASGPIWEHDMSVSYWSDCYLELGKEPEITTSTVMIAQTFDMELSITTHRDLLLAHPWCSEIVKCSGKETGLTASKREAENIECSVGVDRPTLPLVFKHFSCWDEEAISYLKHLARRSTNGQGQQNPSKFNVF